MTPDKTADHLTLVRALGYAAHYLTDAEERLREAARVARRLGGHDDMADAFRIEATHLGDLMTRMRFYTHDQIDAYRTIVRISEDPE